jgi:hypothetical protein
VAGSRRRMAPRRPGETSRHASSPGRPWPRCGPRWPCGSPTTVVPGSPTMSPGASTCWRPAWAASAAPGSPTGRDRRSLRPRTDRLARGTAAGRPAAGPRSSRRLDSRRTRPARAGGVAGEPERHPSPRLVHPGRGGRTGSGRRARLGWQRRPHAPLAPHLHGAGFHAFFLDVRNHGLSDGDRFVSMPRFADDLEVAIGWLRQHAAVTSIGVIGHSVGAGRRSSAPRGVTDPRPSYRWRRRRIPVT